MPRPHKARAIGRVGSFPFNSTRTCDQPIIPTSAGVIPWPTPTIASPGPACLEVSSHTHRVHPSLVYPPLSPIPPTLGPSFTLSPHGYIPTPPCDYVNHFSSCLAINSSPHTTPSRRDGHAPRHDSRSKPYLASCPASAVWYPCSPQSRRTRR